MEVVSVSETIKEIPEFSRYLVNIENGLIYRKPSESLKGKWLKKGKANDIGYVMTTLISDSGKDERVYVHEIVMSAAIESPKSFWISKNLEIDHRDRKKDNNNFFNLQLVTKVKNHENIENRKKAVRLTEDNVKYILEEFKKWTGRKIEFYKLMADKFSCVWQTVQYRVLAYK